MECFDISHTMGEQTVASCVVFDANGPLRAEYRRYNITGITPGDDYAAMNQVLRRRYGKAIEESKIPDVILIDGGKGQLGQAKAVFESLDVSWDKTIRCCWASQKADRKAGLETLFFEPEGEGFSLPPDSRRCTSFSIFAMNRTIMPSAVTAKKGKTPVPGNDRRRGAKTSPDAAEIYGRIARITQRQHGGNCKSAGYFARAGRKDLLLVETLRAL
jgi:excinuclease ABC subunit C